MPNPNQQQEDKPLSQEEAKSIWAAADDADLKEDAEAAQAAATEDRERIQWAKPAEEATPAAEKPAAEAPAPAAKPEAVADPVVLMDRVAGLEQQNQRLMEQLQQLNGKFGGVNSELSRLRNASKDAGVQTPSAQHIQKALQDADSMKQLVADYPEFGGAMQKVLEGYGVNIAKVVDDAVRQSMPQPGQFLTRQEFEAGLREYAVELAAPGWKKKVVLPEFGGWLSRQDAETKALAASDDPADAVALVKKFDDFIGSTTANQPLRQDSKQRRIDSAARLPNGGQGSSVRAKDESQMSPEELWKHLDELEAREGAS